MATKPPTPAETKAKSTIQTKQQTKALEKSSSSSSAPWNKPTLSELKSNASSSIPLDKPSFSEIQGLEESSHTFPLKTGPSTTKPGLKPMQTLTECLQLLQQLAEEVNNISQCGSKKTEPEEGTKEPGSLETSRTLILRWAKELEQNMVKKETKSADKKTRRRDDPGKKEETEVEKHNDRLQQWAKELKNITEANGVSDEELKKLLYPRGAKESRMAAILPLLEFVAWSLLSEDTEEAVSMRWLPTKQKAWKTGTGSPKYIPNSVWQWIQSASVSVRLDASTSHPWLSVSLDRLQVREASARPPPLSDNSQRFTEWPCVLGDTIITAGRHYWEVEVCPDGSWRVGVISESAPRNKKPTMSPRKGYWVLWKGPSMWACTDEPTRLQRAAVPRLIGVYVDVGEGQVSFYDVDRRVHIYTFSDTFKHSLIPMFGCLDGRTVLKIKPA
ncbi:E3 ubiquitin-protein ligase TRIM39-like isoform X2 [Epinephelus fuscoguttatus]|nr:E3 ubiquitin-protein ligase TRIM39-like isoform X2 [Epinephelus fuscoguttatus]XP_049425324.1 E3 ubiquitin-protein ligase TRIM39-like isoform X2 [Epinephelus fuscoguttatus]XP_049425327.1 E3 ubiquitin-protein ligase TRIM39-like isoform X2 [Epinephelus fuscoguttatus]